MIETSDGIATPSEDDEQNLVQDLAAMAVTVQNALNKRANSYKGTVTARTQFTQQAEDGVLWKDTNGTRALWVKQGTSWERIWPESSFNLTLGSSTVDTTGYGGQLQIRRFYPSSGTNSHVNLVVGTSETIGLQAIAWRNMVPSAELRLSHSGQLYAVSRKGGTVSRPVPFATAAGFSSITTTASQSTVTSTLSFPTGRFTSIPRVFIQQLSAAPQLNHFGVHNISASQASVTMHRATAATVEYHWFAIQPGSTASTNPDA